MGMQRCRGDAVMGMDVVAVSRLHLAGPNFSSVLRAAYFRAAPPCGDCVYLGSCIGELASHQQYSCSAVVCCAGRHADRQASRQVVGSHVWQCCDGCSRVIRIAVRAQGGCCV